MRHNRLILAVAVGIVLIVPASGLRLACVGASCKVDTARASGPVPFCSLPPEVQERVAAGFYDGRSPEILGITEEAGTLSAGPGLSWPSLADVGRVPLVFIGDALGGVYAIPTDTQLTRVAPTVAKLIGFTRPYPGLERTEPIAGIESRSAPRLIVEVALKGIGTRELRAGLLPTVARSLRQGTGTPNALVGSTPLDPTAVLTTIGTGTLPSEHGITGNLLRSDDGQLVRAWSSRAPASVVATLAEDLDQTWNQRPLIGLVGGSSTDLGLIGGGWYPEHDRDLRAPLASANDVVARAGRWIANGFGKDNVPDILGVILDGRAAELDRALGRLLIRTKELRNTGVVFVVVGTGSADAHATNGPRVVEQAVDPGAVGIIEGQVPGGLFLDADALVAAGRSRQQIRDDLASLTDVDGRPMVADAFLSYSVAFGKYC